MAKRKRKQTAKARAASLRNLKKLGLPAEKRQLSAASAPDSLAKPGVGQVPSKNKQEVS